MAIMKQTVEIKDPNAINGRRAIVVVKPHRHVSEEQEAAAAETAAQEPDFIEKWEKMRFDPSSMHIGAHNAALEEGGLQNADFIVRKVLTSRQDKDMWKQVLKNTRKRGKDCLKSSNSTHDIPKISIGMEVASEKVRREKELREHDEKQPEKEPHKEEGRAHTQPMTQSGTMQPARSSSHSSVPTANAVHAQITKVRGSKVMKPQPKNASAGDVSRGTTRTYSPPAHKFGASTVASRSRSPAKAAPTTTEQNNTAEKPEAKTPIANDDRTSNATHTRGQSPQRSDAARVTRNSRSTAQATPASITSVQGDRAGQPISTSSIAKGVPKTHTSLMGPYLHEFWVDPHHPGPTVNDMPKPSTNRAGQPSSTGSTTKGATRSHEQRDPLDRSGLETTAEAMPMPTTEESALAKKLISLVRQFSKDVYDSIAELDKELASVKLSGRKTSPEPCEDNAKWAALNICREEAVERLLKDNHLTRLWKPMSSWTTQYVNLKLELAGLETNHDSRFGIKFRLWDKDPSMKSLINIAEGKDSTVETATVRRVQQHEAAKPKASGSIAKDKGKAREHELLHPPAEVNDPIQRPSSSGSKRRKEPTLGSKLQTFGREFVARATAASEAKHANASTRGTPSRDGTEPQTQLNSESSADFDNAIQGLEHLYKSVGKSKIWEYVQRWIGVTVTDTLKPRGDHSRQARDKETYLLWQTDESLIELRKLWLEHCGSGVMES